MDKKVKVFRSFADIQHETWGEDYKNWWSVWRIINPETAGSEHCRFGINILPAGMKFPDHAHEKEDEIYLILEGHIGLRCGMENFEMQRYDAAYMPAGTPHETRNLGIKDALLAWFVVPINK